MSIDPKRSRVVFQKLEEDLIKLSSKPRAESVHRFRTGTRFRGKLDEGLFKLLKNRTAALGSDGHRQKRMGTENTGLPAKRQPKSFVILTPC